MAKAITSTAHTPGPWFKSRNVDGEVVIKATRNGCDALIASTLYDQDNEPAIEELESNARLIAAAPELYHTLLAITNDCEAWLNEKMNMSANDLLAGFMDAADAAISLAGNNS